MQPQDALQAFGTAIWAADRPWASGAEDRASWALYGARTFAESLPPDFYQAYLTVPTARARQYLQSNHLFAPRPLPARAVYGPASKSVSTDQVAKEMGEVYGSEPLHLRACMERLKGDYQGCALQSAQALLAATRLAGEQAQAMPLEAFYLYSQVLASKPYTKALQQVGEQTRAEFFLQVSLCLVHTSLPANQLSLGAQTANKALRSSLFLSAAEPGRVRTYAAAFDLIVLLGQHIDAALEHKESFGLSTDPNLLPTLRQALSLWTAVGAVQHDLARCIDRLQAVDPKQANELLQAAQAAQEMLTRLSAAASLTGRSVPVPTLKSLALRAPSDLLPGALPLWNGHLDDYAPWPPMLAGLLHGLQQASCGEPVAARNYLLDSPPGSGKSTLWQAFLAEVHRQREARPADWPLDVKGFELLDGSALASTFDESRRKVDDFFSRLVVAGQREGFVPVVVVDEVQKYLAGGSGQGGPADLENRRIGAAFHQWMDNTRHACRNNLFFVCTTNDHRALSKPALGRFLGHIESYVTPPAIKRRLLAQANLAWPVAAGWAPGAAARLAAERSLMDQGRPSAESALQPQLLPTFVYGEAALAVGMRVPLRSLEVAAQDAAAVGEDQHATGPDHLIAHMLPALLEQWRDYHCAAPDTQAWAECIEAWAEMYPCPERWLTPPCFDVGSSVHHSRQALHWLTDAARSGDLRAPSLSLLHACEYRGDWALLLLGRSRLFSVCLQQAGNQAEQHRHVFSAISVGQATTALLAPKLHRFSLQPNTSLWPASGLSVACSEEMTVALDAALADRRGVTAYLGFIDSDTGAEPW